MNCIVMETNGTKAVLLGSDDRFITVRNKNYQIGQKVIYRPAAPPRAIASLAAGFLLVFLGLGGYKLYYTPVSYMSIDINPSIQLSLNILNRVIDTSAFNEDGENILKDVRLKNYTAEESIRKIIECTKKKGYFSGSDKSVIVDIFDTGNRVSSKISKLPKEYKEVDVIIESAETEDKDLSDKMGISIGRAHSLRDYSKATGAPLEEIDDEIKYADVMKIKEKTTDAAKSQTPQSPPDTGTSGTKTPETGTSGAKTPGTGTTGTGTTGTGTTGSKTTGAQTSGGQTTGSNPQSGSGSTQKPASNPSKTEPAPDSSETKGNNNTGSQPSDKSENTGSQSTQEQQAPTKETQTVPGNNSSWDMNQDHMMNSNPELEKDSWGFEPADPYGGKNNPWENDPWKDEHWQNDPWQGDPWQEEHWQGDPWQNDPWQGDPWQDEHWQDEHWQDEPWREEHWRNDPWREEHWRDEHWNNDVRPDSIEQEWKDESQMDNIEQEWKDESQDYPPS